MCFETLIFDIDGTLWDSRALVAEGYNIQLKQEGLDHLCVDAEILKAQFGKVKDDIADDLFASIPAPERYRLIDRCMDMERQYMRENECRIGYTGVRETMEQLAKKYRLFLVSNCECGYPELCIEKMGLTPYVQGHLCFGDTGTSKGKTILKLMKEHNIQNCAYIGDTQGDYQATLEAGIPFIWASYGFGNPEGYAKKIHSFEELLNL